mmetsp:Transcript_5802/g.13998  ORF Transcript_5802/g.13998 Transcript_5802/m.13998 type:complete len:247 (-) Transcript_5802:518-1258(-)
MRWSTGRSTAPERARTTLFAWARLAESRSSAATRVLDAAVSAAYRMLPLTSAARRLLTAASTLRAAHRFLSHCLTAALAHKAAFTLPPSALPAALRAAWPAVGPKRRTAACSTAQARPLCASWPARRTSKALQCAATTHPASLRGASASSSSRLFRSSIAFCLALASSSTSGPPLASSGTGTPLGGGPTAMRSSALTVSACPGRGGVCLRNAASSGEGPEPSAKPAGSKSAATPGRTKGGEEASAR